MNTVHVVWQLTWQKLSEEILKNKNGKINKIKFETKKNGMKVKTRYSQSGGGGRKKNDNLSLVLWLCIFAAKLMMSNLHIQRPPEEMNIRERVPLHTAQRVCVCMLLECPNRYKVGIGGGQKKSSSSFSKNQHENPLCFFSKR